MPPATPFGEIPREPRLSDKVVNAIVDTIVSRQLSPGDALPSERELGKQFGVSRTVIREAVRELSAQGLLTVKTGSGMKIISVGTEGITESMRHFLRGSMLEYSKVAEIRRILEVEAARLAAERATKQDVAMIQAAFHQMAELGQDLGALAQADLDFHRAIALATHNELFTVLHDSIGESLLEVRRTNLSWGKREEEIAEVTERHRAILQALDEGDPDAAAEAMAAHLAQVESRWHAGRADPARAPLAAAVRPL